MVLVQLLDQRLFKQRGVHNGSSDHVRIHVRGRSSILEISLLVDDCRRRNPARSCAIADAIGKYFFARCFVFASESPRVVAVQLQMEGVLFAKLLYQFINGSDLFGS